MRTIAVEDVTKQYLIIFGFLLGEINKGINPFEFISSFLKNYQINDLSNTDIRLSKYFFKI